MFFASGLSGADQYLIWFTPFAVVVTLAARRAR
jgi:hypothetical protein